MPEFSGGQLKIAGVVVGNWGGSGRGRGDSAMQVRLRIPLLVSRNVLGLLYLLLFGPSPHFFFFLDVALKHENWNDGHPANEK